MQQSDRVMDSTSQMPQETASPSQPPQMANEPQQIQHETTTQDPEDHKKKQNMIVSQHVQEISSATSPGPEVLLPQEAPHVSTMPMQSLILMHGAQQAKQVMCELQEKLKLMSTLQQKPQMSAQQKQQVNTEQQPIQQARTMQHHMQQSEKNIHVSHETSTTPPIMPSLLEETPVAQQVSENNQTQLSTNNTLQKMQLNTQQCKNQQEMIVLFEEDGTSPLNLRAVLTSLPTPQKAKHIFIAPEQALPSITAPQMAKDEINASQKHPQAMPQSQLNPQVTASSHTSAPERSLDYMVLMKYLDFSLILEFLSLTPMIGRKPPPTGSFGDMASISGSEQDITVDIQNQSVHDKNMHMANSETIQKNQDQPSQILSDFHKNLMSFLLSDEDAEVYYAADCKSTPPISKDKLEALQDLEQCDLETTDSDTSYTFEIKESTYVRKMRNAFKARGMKTPNQIIPSTGSYCRLRHDLLQNRRKKTPKEKTESHSNMPPAKISFCFKAEDGSTVYLAPSGVLMSPQKFLQRITVPKDSENARSNTEQLKIYCGLQISSKKPYRDARIHGVRISVTQIPELLHYLSRQANPNAIQAHVYVFSALLQKLHLKNQAACEYFKDIVAECLKNSEVLMTDQHDGVANSQTQTGAGREINGAQDGGEFNITTSEGPPNVVSTDESSGFQEELLQNSSTSLGNKQSQERKQGNIVLLKEKKVSPPIRAHRTLLEAVTRFCVASPSNSPGFVDRVHLQMLLRFTATVLNNRVSLRMKNDSDTSIQTVSLTEENKKIGRCCIINWNQKFKRSNKARDQLKNLKHCCLTCKTQSSVTSGSESNDNVNPSTDSNSRSVHSLRMPGRMPKKNEQEDMQRTMRLAKLQEWRELCDILCAGEDAILACADGVPSFMKTQKPEMTQVSERATDSKPNVSSHGSSSQDSGFTPVPGELYMLMPTDDPRCLVWSLLILSIDGGKIDAKFYESTTGGFIEYIKTSEVLQHARRSNNATEHSKPKSTRITNNTVPSCNCNGCINGGGIPTPAISNAAMMIDSFEVLMQALVLDATLEGRHCKKGQAAEKRQVCKCTKPDDTKENNTKKEPNENPQRERH